MSKHYPLFSELNIKPFLHQQLGQRQHFNAYFFETDKIQLLRRRNPKKIHFFHYDKQVQSPLCRVLEVVKWPEFISHPVTWDLNESIKRQEYPPDWVSSEDMKHNRLWRVVARWLKNQLLRHNRNSGLKYSIGSLLCGISGGRLARKK